MDAETAEDATRLHEQGWPVDRIAQLFECGESEIRGILNERRKRMHSRDGRGGVSWIQ